MNFILRNRLLAALALFMILLVPLLMMFSGCASKLQGNERSNEPPEVGFINSPPESTNFSRNTVIYWWGTDRDGIIDYFRYHVATDSQVGGDPNQYIAGLVSNDDVWTVVDVDIVNSDPGTEQIIRLSADLDDPVNTFVLQYVFLQAFDEEGSASTVVWRIFGRNDNPPNTIIFNPSDADIPFVNAVQKGGVITGVKMRWAGTDVIDYPADPPPFEFNYRLYGPYDSAQYAQLTSQFFTKRYLTATGRVHKIGDTIVTCDTTVIFPQQITCDTLPNGDTTSCDTTTLPPDTNFNCTSLIIRSTTPTTAFGGLQDYFFIDSPNFDTTKLVFQSNNPLRDNADRIWVEKTADTIFNVFENFNPSGAADTTIEMNFVFWVRSRDDALVPDLVPAFKGVKVINPRYERGVLIVDMSVFVNTVKGYANSYINVGRDTVAHTFWYNTIKKWADAYGDPSLYLDTNNFGGFRYLRPDYYQTGGSNGNIPISWLLKHKVVIVYNEGIFEPNFAAAGPNIYKAIDAGVNVWVTARSLGGNGKGQPFTVESKGLDYARYFGVALAIYSGWGCHAFGANDRCPQARIEDFIGAYAKTGWPEISVDTARLHSKLRWATPDDNVNYPSAGWIDSQPNHCLPEVGWSVRTFGTELLYRYKSFYGNAHPRGRSATEDFIFEGAPCGHRLNAGLFRTVHMNFTPLVLDTIGCQTMADSILNWLYDPTLGTTSMNFDKPRYPEAALQISVEEARENYRRRVEEYELLNANKVETFNDTEY